MNHQTTIIVVRHGNTFNSGDTILRVGGATDIPLTEKGVAQAVAAGKAIAGLQLPPVAAIYSAPLLRTSRTASEIAANFPGIEVKTMQFLTELPYGVDDGAPEDDVVARIGILESLSSITAETTMDDLRAAGKAALKRWDNEAILPKAWAHLQSTADQLNCQWQEFAAMVQNNCPGKTVIAVTSNGIARFSKALLPAGITPPENLKLATGAFGVYTLADGQWQCAMWNVRPEL